jgi:hypothetical protein
VVPIDDVFFALVLYEPEGFRIPFFDVRCETLDGFPAYTVSPATQQWLRLQLVLALPLRQRRYANLAKFAEFADEFGTSSK